ncbi:hypothetical protein B0I35DRAFT_461312 [Stachybotrys elegans]|uniref:Uncharacterized protein n=1 Tax=Stachybotrys elegans TaxID=80388 RepID=A0A8K0ST32_9HYPO|nr:hypothetical protein B0I35DRAFT_461312 [Stachybotrys elegans]
MTVWECGGFLMHFVGIARAKHHHRNILELLQRSSSAATLLSGTLEHRNALTNERLQKAREEIAVTAEGSLEQTSASNDRALTVVATLYRIPSSRNPQHTTRANRRRRATHGICRDLEVCSGAGAHGSRDLGCCGRAPGRKRMVLPRYLSRATRDRVKFAKAALLNLLIKNVVPGADILVPPSES